MMWIESGFVFAFLTTLFWSISNVMAKRPAADMDRYKAGVLVVGGGIIPSAILYIIAPAAIGGSGIFFSFISGVFLALGAITFYKALETQQTSNSYALVVVQSVLVSVFGIAVLGQPLSVISAVGAAICIAGVLMVSTTTGFNLNRKLLPALAGNVFWALSWFAADYAISLGSNYVAVINVMRIVGTVIAIIAYIAARRPSRAAKPAKHRHSLRTVSIGIAGGIFSGMGNLAFGYVAVLQFVSIGGIFTAFAPALTAVLACLVYRERLTTMQWFGVAVATCGAVLLAFA